MSRLTRRRFLANASTFAGTVSLSKRLGWAQGADPSEVEELKLWYEQPAMQWVDALHSTQNQLNMLIMSTG